MSCGLTLPQVGKLNPRHFSDALLSLKIVLKTEPETTMKQVAHPNTAVETVVP